MKRTATTIKAITRASVGMLIAGMFVGLAPPLAGATPVVPVVQSRSTTTSVPSGPVAAQARTLAVSTPCQAWELPHITPILQGNGWYADLHFEPDLHWRAIARRPQEMYGDVMFSNATADLVEFTITWSNDSAGVYHGKIDSNGFVSGEASDRWNSGVTTTWRMGKAATCTRR